MDEKYENIKIKPEQSESGRTFAEYVSRLEQSDVVVYERLNASNDKLAKAEFLSDPNLEHPNNEYGNLDATLIYQNLDAVERIRDELKSSQLPKKQQMLLLLLADDRYKKNDFLAANIAYNEAKTPEEKKLMARWHHEANVSLYGAPDREIFYCLLGEKIAKIHPSTPEEEQELAELKAKIGPIPEGNYERFRPKEETVSRFHEIVEDFFGSFLKHIPKDKASLTTEETAAIVNEILDDEFGGADVKYRATVDSSASNASVNHQERIIKFPEGKTYSKNKAASLIVHELGTHVMRAIPYLESEIQAFSTELPGNETFDEGIAKCIEQAIAGKYEDSGIDHYINIGLATFAGKNFREVYDIQKSLKKLNGEKDTTLLNAVQRCFRGTGELPNNKDLAYYNGANQVWRYIEDHIDDPYLMDSLFLSGKANIQDETQERLVYEMKQGGILH